VAEDPEAPKVVDGTGFAVGSPEWLEAQRRIERGQTPDKQRRQALWEIAFGAIIISISVFTTITILTGEDSLGISLTPAGYLAVSVAPLLIGGYAIFHGLRQRAR
jgi:hypothetical protein